MKRRNRTLRALFTPLARLGGLGTLALLLASALVQPRHLAADDRDLLRESEAEPYIFIILDTSGSMNWQPGGDAFAPTNGDDPRSKMYQAKSALYRLLTDAELRDVHWGFATYNQNDARLYRKHWAYTPRTNPSWTGTVPYPMVGQIKTFGDRCFDDTDNTAACDAVGQYNPGGVGGGIDSMGCCGSGCSDFRRLDQAEGLGEALTFPQLGHPTPAVSIREYLRTATANRYRMTWTMVAGSTLGDASIQVTLRLDRRTSADCNNAAPAYVLVAQENIWFDQAITQDLSTPPRALSAPNDFIVWQRDADVSGANPAGFWDHVDSDALLTCQSWEANDDTTNDDAAGVNLKRPTVTDPAGRGTAFGRGDVVPFDWQDGTVWATAVNVNDRINNRQAILKRLAPNLTFDASGIPTNTPDFRVAHYLQNAPDTYTPTSTAAGRLAPLAAFVNDPPLLPSGSTPIGSSLKSFLDWFDDWKATASSATGDLRYECRSVNVIFLTDGDETCFDGGACSTGVEDDNDGEFNPTEIARQLFEDSDREVKTYMIGFGLPNVPGNFLECVSDAGGTGDLNGDGDNDDDPPGPAREGPFYPATEDDLVAILSDLAGTIRSESRTLASATVPSVQADAADKLFLTQFTPVKDVGVWPGEINAFLKPIPLDAQGRPDTSAACDAVDDSACHLWEAQEVIVAQQVTPSVANPVGPNANQRRIYYSEFASDDGDITVPRTRHFLLPTAAGDPASLKHDLWRGFNIPFVAGNAPSEAAAETQANAIIDQVTALKSVSIAGIGDIDYVIGDIFHSDPRVIGSPGNNKFFLDNRGTALAAACTPDSDDQFRKYRDFSIQQARRRRVLVFGSNDGALHGLDSGVFRESGDFEDRFDNGTGRELFAYIPRLTMPVLKAIYADPTSNPQQEWTVDGRVVAGDFLIDPVHDGIGSGDAPAACDRRWRTVLIGGLREGAADSGDLDDPQVTDAADQLSSGYYALDLTQPDVVEQDATDAFKWVPTVNGDDPPACLTTNGEGTSIPAGCGPVAYATPMWEFTDSILDLRLDEDDNLAVDLAPTWSTPNVGLIKVCVSECDNADPALRVIEERDVAIVGGGLDAERMNLRGNWLYIIDIESGEAIYKRLLLGSAPSEPAAVDTDFDGFLDRIYIGTTFGFLYRVDLVDKLTTPGETLFPEIEDVDISEVDAGGATLTRGVHRIVDDVFKPRILFNASAGAAGTTVLQVVTGAVEAQPIYYRPSVIFVPEIEKYAVAFGTGNREDLFDRNQPAGRLFVVLDDQTRDQLAEDLTDVPLNQFDLFEVDLATVATANADRNFLTAPDSGFQGGWWAELDINERLVTDPFAFAGILFFSAFTPAPEVATGDALCSQAGTSRVFAVITTNARGILREDPDDAASARARFISVPDLVTSPFTEQAQTKNPPPPQSGPAPSESLPESLTEGLKEVMKDIAALQPAECKRIPGFRVDIKTRTSGTGIVFVAPVPLCIVEKNFKEF